MNIELTKIYNNCNIVKINKDVELLFSYNSCIGLCYNDYLILNDYYINYSKTTSKHIKLLKDHYYIYNNIIIISNNHFKDIINSNYNIDYLKKLLNFDVQSYIILKAVEDLQSCLKNKKIDLNNFDNKFKDLKNYLNNNSFNYNLKILDYKVEQLKTVNKIIITYKVNNIIFTVIKTYNKSFKNFKSCNIKNVEVEPIEYLTKYC